MSLYERQRPLDLNGIVGQERAVAILKEKMQDNLPHVILLAGPTGTGKTTIANILAGLVGCTPANLTRVNCAAVRGIDSVRELSDDMGPHAMGGKSRVWILDEVVQLPKTTQQAFLDLLEKVPKHVYFFLCTSETAGLLPTFVGRCFVLTLVPLFKEPITKILNKAAGDEGKPLFKKTIDFICHHCDGSARKALQMAEAALTSIKNAEDQLSAVGGAMIEQEEKHKFLALALMQCNPWKEIVKIISDLEDKDLEGLRRQVLGYCAKVLMGGGGQAARAYVVILAFREPWFSCGKAGLVAACWECQPKR